MKNFDGETNLKNKNSVDILLFILFFNKLIKKLMFFMIDDTN